MVTRKRTTVKKKSPQKSTSTKKSKISSRKVKTKKSTSAKEKTTKRKIKSKTKTPKKKKSTSPLKRTPPKVSAQKVTKQTKEALENLKKLPKAKILGAKKSKHSASKASTKAKGLKISNKKSFTSKFNLSDIKNKIEFELRGKGKRNEETKIGKKGKTNGLEFIQTGVSNFDELLHQGIPKGAAILLSGGAGCGKTIFGLQSLAFHAANGKKCMYMSFEESEERLVRHMEQFGIPARKLIKKGNLLIQRFNPFDITRSVDALLMKAKGELLIDVKPIIFPKNFKPEIIVVDSLTAIASAFTGKEDSYRIYIEQLFRFFEDIGATSYLITETTQVPTIYSTTGVEEFLADAVIVMYNIRRGNTRERAIEMLKLRGAGHEMKLVAMNITSEGINVYPDQEVFGGLEEER